jgi:hypothetical protein
MIVSVIVMIFTASAAMVFIQLIQTSDAIDARVEAVKNCRFFLDTLANDLASASLSSLIPTGEIFRGTDNPLTHGDLRDNDLDGAVDEESPDGEDNDGDWTLATDDYDFRTVISTSGGSLPPLISLAERGWEEPDLGDGHVDEDVVFNSDTISFWQRGPLTGNVQLQRITYGIEPFEGEDNVAVRRTLTIYNDGTPDLEEVGPLAFNVVSLNFLHWDHEAVPQGWVEVWDGTFIPTDELAAPVAVHASITVYADAQPLSMPPTRPLTTVQMSTICVLENVLRSSDYPRGEERPEGEPPLVFPRSNSVLSPSPEPVTESTPQGLSPGVS